MAAPVTRIYINPGDQGVNVLDFTHVDDIKFYQKAIEGLDKSERFDLSPTKLKSFLDNICQKAEVYGWNGVLDVPTIVAAPAVPMINNFIRFIWYSNSS
jgi:hypothetical protein